jgi:hypothetical protein
MFRITVCIGKDVNDQFMGLVTNEMYSHPMIQLRFEPVPMRINCNL